MKYINFSIFNYLKVVKNKKSNQISKSHTSQNYIILNRFFIADGDHIPWDRDFRRHTAYKM